MVYNFVTPCIFQCPDDYWKVPFSSMYDLWVYIHDGSSLHDPCGGGGRGGRVHGNGNFAEHHDHSNINQPRML